MHLTLWALCFWWVIVITVNFSCRAFPRIIVFKTTIYFFWRATKVLSFESVADSPWNPRQFERLWRLWTGNLLSKANSAMIQISQERQELSVPLLRCHWVAHNVVKHSPQKVNWTAMQESTPIHNNLRGRQKVLCYLLTKLNAFTVQIHFY